MKSVSEAFTILENNIPNSKTIFLNIEEVLGYVLAEDIFSPLNMPPFRQSAMDGFAIQLHENLTYTIVGEIKAGDSHQIDLKPGEATWIFTGAAVPENANAVIQIEKTSTQNSILLLTENPKIDTNIRPIGEQISKGELALKKGVLLNAAAIGFLAGLGIVKVEVFKKSTVGVIVTGNELIERGNSLELGQVYESNGLMIQMVLNQYKYDLVRHYKVQDNLLDTRTVIDKALKENDIIILSGGISVGNYDFVAKALEQLNVEILFHKIKQQQGKPFCVGKLDDKLVFALPGNPAASLTFIYIYVLPVLERISGKQNQLFDFKFKNILHSKEINNPRDQFFKAKVNGETVEILSHQASSMLSSFATANALVYIEAGQYTISVGDKVKVFTLY